MIHEEELRFFLKDETVATFRVVYAQLAASCATMAAAIREDSTKLMVHLAS